MCCFYKIISLDANCAGNFMFVVLFLFYSLNNLLFTNGWRSVNDMCKNHVYLMHSQQGGTIWKTKENVKWKSTYRCQTKTGKKSTGLCGNFSTIKQLFKVAHHTWIKFLKSKQNILIMKNEVTYDRYECPKSKWHINYWWRYVIRKLWQKFLADLNSESAAHKTNALILDHWAMMIYNKVDRYKQFNMNI